MHDLPSPPYSSGSTGHASATAPAELKAGPTNPLTQHRSADQLAAVRTALHAATEAHDNHLLRRRHAHRAADLSADVILRRDSTDEQRRTAGTYLTQAVTMRDDPTPAR